MNPAHVEAVKSIKNAVLNKTFLCSKTCSHLSQNQLVLDSDLKVVKANNSSYRTFKVKSEGTEMKIHTVSHSEGWKVVRAIRGMGTSKQREILK